MLSTRHFGSLLGWPLLATVLFVGFLITANPPAWADPVLDPANQTVPPFDFHLNLPRIVNASAPEDVIFADDFESGNFSSWSASKGNEDALRVSPAAALSGTQGLQVVISDTTTIYVTDNLPAGERRYRARFYFDPNSIVMASGDIHSIFYSYSDSDSEPPQVVLRVQFRFSNGDYQLRTALLDDGTTWTDSDWSTISDAAHAIEIDWQAATTVGANNGSLTFWIDGVQKASQTGIDNDTRRIDRVRLGAVANIDTGTHGTYYFDAFESHRLTYIGPSAGAR